MADVTVLGAGIFGLSIAWTCQQRGARVRVIDPGGPGAGASGGVVGALAPHAPEKWNDKKQFQFESLCMAGSFWGQVEAASGLSSGYARLGRVQPIMDAKMLALAQARAISARDLWAGQADWRIIEADEAPFGPRSPTGLLIHDTLSARVHPRQACLALAEAIRAGGGEVLTEGDPTGRVVHATGVAGLAELTAHFGKAVGAGQKGQGALLDFAAPDMSQIFADTIHIVPHQDGTTAIGSTSERDYDDPRSTDKQLDEVIRRAVAAVPALCDAKVVERWADLRPRTKSRAPMLGAHPIYEGAFIANGGFKIGFGMAPKVGQVMADLMLEGQDAIPPAFRPEASL